MIAPRDNGSDYLHGIRLISYSLHTKHNKSNNLNSLISIGAPVVMFTQAVFFSSLAVKNSTFFGFKSILSAPSRSRISRFSIIHRAHRAMVSCSIQASSSTLRRLDRLAAWFREASSKSCKDVREASNRKSSGIGITVLQGTRIDPAVHPKSCGFLAAPPTEITYHDTKSAINTVVIVSTVLA